MEELLTHLSRIFSFGHWEDYQMVAALAVPAFFFGLGVFSLIWAGIFKVSKRIIRGHW